MLSSTRDVAASEPAVAYDVTAVRYGTLRSRKSALFHRFETYGEPDVEVEMAYYFWVLERDGNAVLVDTGFDPVVGMRRGRTCDVPPLEALERLGIDPGAVSTVLVTHFHYDHIGNLAAFPGAELVLPARELDFWTSEVARRQQFDAHVERSEVELVERAAAAGRVRAIAGDEEVLPGVRMIVVGGHSPGQALVVVAGAGGSAVLTSDAVHFYEELDLDRPFGVVADLEAMYRAYDRIKDLAADLDGAVVVGHDPLVMERFDAAAGDSEIAVQVARNPDGRAKHEGGEA